jgi:hypothetical protein
MLFVSGSTRCHSCGVLIDLVEDLLSVDEPGNRRELSLPKAGFYHYDCLGASPSSRSFLSFQEEEIRKTLAENRADWHLIEANDSLVVAYYRPNRSRRLMFFKKGRSMTFLSAREWLDFERFVLSLNIGKANGLGPGAQVTSNCGFYRMSVTREGPNLLAKEEVDRDIVFTAEAYRRLLAIHAPYGGDLHGFIDFEETCLRKGIQPTHVDGLLSKCRGIVVQLEKKDGRIVVHLKVDKWTKVPLSLAEFHDLQSFLRGLE